MTGAVSAIPYSPDQLKHKGRIGRGTILLIAPADPA